MAGGEAPLQLDLYGLLGVGEKASEKEVKKAYRQKALTCHPDKNPDDPRAAEVFHRLSQALAVLTDATARIIRLREEGSRQLQEQQRLVQEQIRLEREQHVQGKQEGNGAEGRITPKLKLKWKCSKDDETRGGYSEDVLLQILQKYGDVLNLLISSRKTGSAVVEFATVKAAEMAVKNEVGLINNPLKITWLEGQPRNNPSTVLSDSTSQPRTSQASAVSERDYESLVMMRMRQAAERQQLIEQLKREDEEESHT
ncbi:dnaJ homolog subfamily C member 17 isoform X3 [Phalacrocorax aristotelis]|uniref:dnaJ homolog subfamily C member 17 isoform X3 n=1 Tax=Phalacrocorax aristotelis TaxID=126867 RepID=UPI003F4B08E3